MDEVDIEIDVDETSVDGQFQSSDSQQTFNVLVHGLEKYEDLDAFLTQGDTRNDLEFGYDPFQAERNLPDDPHIMESTLDSILGVNEEEEVVMNNEDGLGNELYKSDTKDSVEITNKDVKKYNTRKRRKPFNDDMFVYDSPSSKASLSSNKGEKIRKRQECSLAKPRGKQKAKLLGEGCESDEIESEFKPKDTSEQNQSFDDRRLTRRQSKLTGIKPSSIKDTSDKDSKMETEDDESSRDRSSDDDMSSDVGSNISQEKQKRTKRANAGKSGNTIKAAKRSPEKDESIESNDEHPESKDDYEDDDDNDVDDDDNAEDEDDENYVDEGNKRSSHSEEKSGSKRSSRRGNINDSDTRCDLEHGAEIYKPDSKDQKATETVVDGTNSNPKTSSHGSNVWEKVSEALDASAPQGDPFFPKSKSIPEKTDKSPESASKERKVASMMDKKVNECSIVKKAESEKEESKDTGSETKVKTISLDVFLQNATRKAGKTCRGPGCEIPVNQTLKSIYCSQNCINKYSQYVLQVLAKERSRMGHTSGNYGNERVLVLERQTGKILTGPAAPTEATLAAWLTRHQSFEAMLSSQTTMDEKKEKKMSTEKKPLPPYLRDNPALTKDIRMMTAKILGQKKDSIDVIKTMTSAPMVHPSNAANTSSQLKRIDPIRISVRNVLRESLTNRANGCDDVMVSTNEIKSLAMDLEDELCKACEGVTAKYKYKVKAIVAQIKDLNNKGFFRRLLFGELQPNNLVKMTNEKIASKELALWNEDSNTLELLGGDSNFQPSYSNATKSPPYQPIFDIVSSATSETTSQHGTHFFDMNCKICTGKVPEPSYNPPPKSESNFGYGPKNTAQTSPSSACFISQINPKFPLKNALLPTPHMPPIDGSTLVEIVSNKTEADDLLWTGTIYAKEITSVRINTYLISGSLSTVQEDLPETVHMTGRTSPENIFSLVTQLKSSGKLSKDIAMVYFLASSTSEESFYQSLFNFLSSRNRCGVVLPQGVKKETGRIKEFYLMALSAATPLPAALAPLDGPGLPTTRGDLILGIFVKHAIKIPSVVSPSGIKSTTNTEKSSADSAKSAPKAEVQESSSSGTVNEEEESDIDEKVIYSSVKLDHLKGPSAAASAKPPVVKSSEKPSALVEDEPYDPFDGPAAATGSTSATKAKASQVQVSIAKSVVSQESTQITKSSNSSLSGTAPSNISILASDNIAATMLTTLSAVTNSTSLMEQQKMLQELTQKINEQKVILQQQEQSIKKTILDSSLNVSIAPSSSSSSVTPKKPAPSLAQFTASKTSLSTKDFSSISSSVTTALTPVKTCASAVVTSSTAVITPSSKQNIETKKDEPKDVANSKAQVSRHDKTPASLPSVSGNIFTSLSTSMPSISGNILTSLPANISQLLSGENLKNLKNIMASVTTNKQSTSKIQCDKKVLSVSDKKSLPDENASLVSEKAKEKDQKMDKDFSNGDGNCDLNTNVHGDIDYRFDAKKCQTAGTVAEGKTFAKADNIPEQVGCDLKPEIVPKVPIKKPLLATPPQSPRELVAQSTSSGNIQTDPDSSLAVVESSISQGVMPSEKDVAIWKPLLPCKSTSKDRTRKDEGASQKRRDDKRDRSRSREKKRKRSPDDKYRKSDKSRTSGSESKSKDDEENSKEEKTVIVINDNDDDEDEHSLGTESKDSLGKKTRESSSERSNRKNRSKDRSRESSRSRHAKRHRRSRSRDRRERSSRRSKTRSPAKRQTASKINPFNLPHSLPSLFPSLLQIVSSINQPRKSEAECGMIGPRPVTIPSLLDMLDPSLVPEKYRKADDTGLLGSYKSSESRDHAETKSCKKGLLGDFPNQLMHENKTTENIPIANRDADGMKYIGPNHAGERDQQVCGDSFGGNSAYHAQEEWHPAKPGPAFEHDVGRPDFTHGAVHPQDRTLLPTPRNNDHSDDFSNPPRAWNYSRKDACSKGKADNSSYRSDNYYRPQSAAGLRPPMSQSSSPMHHPRGNEGRPYEKFSRDALASPRGYYDKVHGAPRAPFSSQRYSRRQ